MTLNRIESYNISAPQKVENAEMSNSVESCSRSKLYGLCYKTILAT